MKPMDIEKSDCQKPNTKRNKIIVAIVSAIIVIIVVVTVAVCLIKGIRESKSNVGVSTENAPSFGYSESQSSQYSVETTFTIDHRTPTITNPNLSTANPIYTSTENTIETSPEPTEDELYVIECPAPEVIESEEECEKQEDCIWVKTRDKTRVPKCQMKSDGLPRYITDRDDRIELNPYKGFKKTFTSRESTELYKAVPKIKGTIEVRHIEKNIVRIMLYDEEEKDRYKIPLPKSIKMVGQDFPYIERKYYVFYENNGTFMIKVIRKENEVTLFEAEGDKIFIKDGFQQISTKLPSTNVYGIGEHSRDTFKHDFNYRKWTLFNNANDNHQANQKDDSPGVHPYYTCIEKDSEKSHGVLFYNSNAMEFIFGLPDTLTIRSTVLDMYIFLGDSPKDLTNIYTNFIGTPMMPPLWSLGFQLSHERFNTSEEMKNVIEKHRNAQLPLSAVHTSLGLLNDNKEFTVNEEAFPKIGEYIKEERKKGLHFVININPGILATKNVTYLPYKRGLEKDIFMKWDPNYELDTSQIPTTLNSSQVYGWSKSKEAVVFPDFIKKATKLWWKTELEEYKKLVDYSAICLNMNEPSSFKNSKQNWTSCTEENKNIFAFQPAGFKEMLDNTLCMRAMQDDQYKFSDVHNLYGLHQTAVTFSGLGGDKNTPLSLVISRSTYPTSGKSGGHWLGDNRSEWKYLHRSIIGMLEFSLFGIPYTGADICGFHGNAEPEMCARWMQLGAFYPFMRNHNAEGNTPQDPATIFEEHPQYFNWTKTALENRYKLIPYLETQLVKAYYRGSTVVRPLFFEFPNDTETYDIDRQFLWGPSLLVAPILKKAAKELKIYLPNDVWYDYHTKQVLSETGEITLTNKTYPPIDNAVPLFVRGGHIIPLNSTLDPNKNETMCDNGCYDMLVFIKDGAAKGEFFNNIVYGNPLYKYANFTMTFKNCSLLIEVTRRDGTPIFRNIKIYGYEDETVEDEIVEDEIVEDEIDEDEIVDNKAYTDWNKKEIDLKHDKTLKTVEIEINLNVAEKVQIKSYNITFGRCKNSNTF